MLLPRRVGEEPYRYHWHALKLLPLTLKATPKSRIDLARNRLRSSCQLNWQARSENWHPEDVQNRGRLGADLTSARVVLLGAGALGSALAEQLIRMGVQQLTIIDDDCFEAGNLVRHTLSMSDLYAPKATALAQRLNQVNASAHVIGIAGAIPTAEPVVEKALAEATLLIDATANDIVLKEIPFKSLPATIPVISCSLGIHAERLFFYASPNHLFNWDLFNAWFGPYREEENHLATQLDLPRGIGCWHALVPAPFNRVIGLASIAIELIEQVYTQSKKTPVALCYPWPKAVLSPLPDE
ncbi:hypothetical protein GCM10023189_32930 [Nibrella saemangeumensis]|uniref:THIF-type NAD/FAD binding fold domain-containing protein n=1 Tax=Nibrella saemangeumensis TaxID=1084526 RepID=A0ABP8N3G3_9BACT